MTRLLGNGLPLPYLRRSELQNGQPAKAEIPRILGGNVRFHDEWINGVSPGWGGTDADPPCAPLTANVPHESTGLAIGIGPGHDHSGGVMGVPIVRNVFMTTYGEINNGQTGGRGLTVALTSTKRSYDLVDTAISALWVPWCMSDGCYNSLAWRIWVNATAVCNYAMTLYCGPDRIYSTGSLAGTGYEHVTAPRELLVKPRKFNHVGVKFNVSYDGSHNSTVYALAWGFFQTKTTA